MNASRRPTVAIAPAVPLAGRSPSISGGVFLSDFGLAGGQATGPSPLFTRLTRTGATLGTPAYMSPELARGEVHALTPASDVWALGCVLYECAAGRRAFEGEDPAEVLGAILLRSPVSVSRARPDVPSGVWRVARACLARRANDRPPSAHAVRDDCARLLRGERVRHAAGGRAWRFPLAAAGALAAAAAGAVIVVRPSDDGAPPERAGGSAVPSTASGLADRAWRQRVTDPAEAARLLSQAVAAAPSQHAWWLQLGLLRWSLGDVSTARQIWASIPPTAPEYDGARFYLGVEAWTRTAIDDAWPDLEATAAGGGPRAQVAAAIIAVQTGRNAEARALLRAADGWEAALVRACLETWRPTDGPAAAIRDYDLALADGVPISWALVNRGQARLACGDPAGAAADYDRAIALDERCALAYHNRALLRLQAGDARGGRADLDAAIDADPDLAGAWASRSEARCDAGDLAGAIADADEALRRAPRLARAYDARGRARALGRDFAGAVADFDCLLALEPGDAHALQGRGSAKGDLGDHAGAIRDLDAVIASSRPRTRTTTAPTPASRSATSRGRSRTTRPRSDSTPRW